VVFGRRAWSARGGWTGRRGWRLAPGSAAWLGAAVAVALAAPAAPALHAQPAVVAADPGLERLEREIAQLAELAGGTVGVAAVHLETGRAVYHNRTERFPMASSYKVPIAVELLTRV